MAALMTMPAGDLCDWVKSHTKKKVGTNSTCVLSKVVY